MKKTGIAKLFRNKLGIKISRELFFFSRKFEKKTIKLCANVHNPWYFQKRDEISQ